MLERVHINLSLFAGLLVTAISIMLDIPFQTFAVRLTIALSIFYVIGCFVRVYLKNKVFLVENSYFMEEDDHPNPLPIVEEREIEEETELNKDDSGKALAKSMFEQIFQEEHE